MSYERSKAPLALMEQIIMILVFAVTAAVCLQAFVYSNQLSEQGERQEAAASGVQKIAEYTKAEKGNLDEVCEKVNGSKEANGLVVNDTKEGMRFVLQITEQTDYLMKARITAWDENKQEIYTTDIAWQK